MTEAELEKLSSFLRSLVTHGLLLAFVYWFFLNRDPRPQDQDLIAVEYPSPKRVSPHSDASRGSRSDSTAASTSHRVRLEDLGVRFSPLAPAPETHEPQGHADSAVAQDFTGGWDLLNPDPKRARFNRYIYQTVQRWLDHESMMNRLQLTGTVKVRIWFDGEGNYLASQTQYRAVDSDFQRIVDRALQLAFQEPVPKAFLFTDQTFFIDREVYVRPY
jgi:hypothetical protein